jgi:hypothetical protein
MQIKYPSHHQWLKDISSGFEIDFSGSVAQQIHSPLPNLADFGVDYTIESLSAAFLSDFMPMYEAEIGAKQNALLHDVPGKTLYNKEAKFPYFCLSLRENGVFIGGAIFSVRPDRLAFAYRAFNNHWTKAKLRAGPALIGEYAVAQQASELGCTYLSHGKDRNPYGPNANIGLATFKLSVGCRPLVRGEYEISTIDTDTLKEDCLILEMPKAGTQITKAYLITSPLTEEKYIRATKYPNLLQVEVIYRNS